MVFLTKFVLVLEFCNTFLQIKKTPSCDASAMTSADFDEQLLFKTRKIITTKKSTGRPSHTHVPKRSDEEPEAIAIKSCTLKLIRFEKEQTPEIQEYLNSADLLNPIEA